MEKIVNGFENGILPLSKKVSMKTDSGDPQLGISDTSKEKRFVNFLEQIRKVFWQVFFL